MNNSELATRDSGKPSFSGEEQQHLQASVKPLVEVFVLLCEWHMNDVKQGVKKGEEEISKNIQHKSY